jgi:general secretion pathway protein M
MKQWFLGLEKQQQWTALLGGMVLLLLMLLLLVWQPLGQASQRLSASNQQISSSLQWMQNAAAEIKRLRKQNPSAQTSSNSAQNLSSVINTTVKANGLPMSRFQPDGQNEAQVWLDGVAFKDLMAWVSELERSKNVNIDSLSVNKTSTSGVVNARVRLQK